MQFLIARALTAVVAIQTPSVGTVTRSSPVVVRAVLDGDTIDVATVGRVRLLGIDAPEIGRRYDTPAPFAYEARERLVALVLRRWVRLEREGPGRDIYSRHLAYVVREDGVFVNAALVRDGLARVNARLPLSRLEELKRAESEAQTFRRGMWGATPQIPSAGYTRQSPGGRLPPVKSNTPRKARPKKTR